MVLKSSFPLVALLATAPLQVWAAIGPSANLTVANADISPDGFSRTAVVVTSDAGDIGPLITATLGDTFQLNVTNSLTDTSMNVSTSVHWHGLIQRGTTWADGAAFVSQCPIGPNHSFEYNFQASSAGTFWYHSHLRTQYCEGLRGPIVVYDPNDAYIDEYDVDDESTVITLADWYHEANAADTVGNDPLSTLINGKGRFSGGDLVDLSVVTVESGKKYRLRIISTSCEPNYTFSIDNHTMTVIEVDGTLHEPVDVDSIQIFAGQRYSVILNANQTVDNYWIRALPNLGNTTFDDGLNSAILRYSGADIAEPDAVTAPTSTAALSESSLIPLVDPGAPGTHTLGAADNNINLALGFTNGVFTINDVSYTSPTVPVLLQILSGSFTAEDLLPSGSVYVLPRNASVEISIPASGAPGGPHPMHMHGHVFDVVRVAGSTTYNYDNPLRRDVVSIGDLDTDNVTIRFSTDNPGPWILHCHIDRHLLEGLAIVFAEAADETSVDNPVPDSWSELCPIYDALDAEDQ